MILDLISFAALFLTGSFLIWKQGEPQETCEYESSGSSVAPAQV